jgi:phage shock protein C
VTGRDKIATKEVAMNDRLTLPEAPGGGPGPTPAPPAGEGRPLRRSRTDKVLFGVCGGLGRQFGVDPVLLRIAFVVLTLANGVGILLYIIAAIVIPEERPGEPMVAVRPSDPGLGRMIVGGALVALGGLLLVDRFVPIAGQVFLPLIVVVIGLAVLLKGVQR